MSFLLIPLGTNLVSSTRGWDGYCGVTNLICTRTWSLNYVSPPILPPAGIGQNSLFLICRLSREHGVYLHLVRYALLAFPASFGLTMVCSGTFPNPLLQSSLRCSTSSIWALMDTRRSRTRTSETPGCSPRLSTVLTLPYVIVTFHLFLAHSPSYAPRS